MSNITQTAVVEEKGTSGAPIAGKLTDYFVKKIG